ncbi:MAG: hypothetical protein LBD93_04580 [Treponema sp.]|jgi:hypothetical protein|nr:hypothetical protein [Treponema sp.]
MGKKYRFLSMVLGCIAGVSLFAQTHGSVPLDHPVYYLLEQAQVRGLCEPLPEVKPYSRQTILKAINEILDHERTPGVGFGKKNLGPSERLIVARVKQEFERKSPGLDWQRGAYYFNIPIKGRIRFSGDFGVGLRLGFGLGAYPSAGDLAWGTDSWITGYTNGDVGDHFSYNFTISGGLLRSSRTELGTYDSYYKGFIGDEAHSNQEIPVYSQPEAFFPYTYRKGWDGFLFSPGSITAGGMKNWPQDLSIGPSLQSELSGDLLGETVRYRFGRFRREWAGMSHGSSLVFNAAAQPFIALEGTFNPVPWFAFSALTGVLEYYNAQGISESAKTSQNAFSIEQLELNYKNYLHVDVGSTAVWPKRFELGYPFPINNNFMYQNNIGDFDNMGLFFNLKAQYPGIGGLWFSFFADEIEVSSVSRLFELDRHMFALQAGAKAAIPLLPFGSLTVSYTKIEPYCYTHTQVLVPWYGETPMETAYVNNGQGLGYYLAPNSDELRLRLEAMPTLHTQAHFQYQMIRHGASHGSHGVDGSSLLSELDPEGRSENPILRKYFLRDGAYQWQHILKIGAAHTFATLAVPLQVFGEAGVVFSYYTDIAGEPNTGSPSSYSVVDTPEYPRSIGIILTLGCTWFL